MIVINYDDADVLSILTKLHERMGDLGPVMQEIAGYMHASSEQAFANQRDPVTGDPWPEFSDTTLQLRPDRAGGQLLRDSAQLVGSLMQESDGLSAYYATDKPYAAMHQFGGTTSPRSMIPNVEIPARPFLGLDDVAKEDILDMLAGYLVES